MAEIDSDALQKIKGTNVAAGWATLIVMAYTVVSILTVPFVDKVWVSELPVLALVQLPKILPAQHAALDVLIPAMKLTGISTGSWAHDYSRLARPCGLLMVYLIPVLVLLFYAVANRKQMREPGPLLFICLVLALLVADYALTLHFTNQPGLTLY